MNIFANIDWTQFWPECIITLLNGFLTAIIAFLIAYFVPTKQREKRELNDKVNSLTPEVDEDLNKQKKELQSQKIDKLTKELKNTLLEKFKQTKKKGEK